MLENIAFLDTKCKTIFLQDTYLTKNDFSCWYNLSVQWTIQVFKQHRKGRDFWQITCYLCLLFLIKYSQHNEVLYCTKSTSYVSKCICVIWQCKYSNMCDRVDVLYFITRFHHQGQLSSSLVNCPFKKVNLHIHCHLSIWGHWKPKLRLRWFTDQIIWGHMMIS